MYIVTVIKKNYNIAIVTTYDPDIGAVKCCVKSLKVIEAVRDNEKIIAEKEHPFYLKRDVGRAMFYD
jgi:hypothetical protein